MKSWDERQLDVVYDGAAWDAAYSVARFLGLRERLAVFVALQFVYGTRHRVLYRGLFDRYLAEHGFADTAEVDALILELEHFPNSVPARSALDDRCLATHKPAGRHSIVPMPEVPFLPRSGRH